MSAPNNRFHLSRRQWLAVVLVLALLGLLTRVPYTALREERIRAYGETRTVGEVLQIFTEPAADADAPPLTLIDYRFVDSSGRSIERIANVQREVWERLRPGQSITVWYATGFPPLSRVEGQVERPLRACLRRWLARRSD